MRAKLSFILLFLGVAIAATAVILFTSPVAAQNGCIDAKGQPIPCPPTTQQRERPKRPTKTPTSVPIRPTKTPTGTITATPSEVSSFTPTKISTITPTATLNITPNIQKQNPTPYPYPYPGGGTYPYKNPPHNPTCTFCPQTWVWWAGGGVIFSIALAGFLFLLLRGFRGPGSAD